MVRRQLPSLLPSSKVWDDSGTSAELADAKLGDRRQIPHGLSSRERGGLGSDAGAFGATPRCPRSPPRNGRTPVWVDQGMDEPGSVSDAGLEKVRGEFSLTALAYNLRRVLNIVGFTELMAAVAA